MGRKKSMRKQYACKEITHQEYMIYLANQKGLKTPQEYIQFLLNKNGFNDFSEYRLQNINEKGFKNRKEYEESIAHKMGFDNQHDYKIHRIKEMGYIDSTDYKQKKLNERGFYSEREYREWLATEKGFKNYSDYLNSIAIENGFDSNKDYRDKLAINLGYSNYNEYSKQRKYDRGINIPFNKNKECSSYLGVYIAERVLSKTFENVQRMPMNNHGYDFICNKGFKIDVKSACNRKSDGNWIFNIKKNIIADYFLLIAFDSRESLSPTHVWLIKGDTKIITRKSTSNLNEKNNLLISNSVNILDRYKQYELIDKLEKTVECCNSLKQ